MNDQMKVSLAASVIILLAIVGFAAWQGNSEPEPTAQTAEEINQNEGEDVLQGKLLEDFEPISEVSELQIIDIEEGSGEEVEGASATVNAHYTGAVAATGEIFQSSYDSGSPVEFPLNGVIAGWTEGVPGMKVGGTRRLIIPAEKAYADAPPPNSGIPANAPLVFDITLEGIVSQ
jgi:FKBP-type peptidyl-prolyl cis-trans isomerase